MGAKTQRQTNEREEILYVKRTFQMKTNTNFIRCVDLKLVQSHYNL